MNSKRVLLGSGIVLLLLGTFSGYLYGISLAPTRNVTLSTAPDAYNQVASTFTNQLLRLDSKNIQSLTSGYEVNATVEWKGKAGACYGNYSGSAEIGTMLHRFLANVTYIFLSNVSQSIGTEGNRWVVSSTFNFTGNSSVIGAFEGTVTAQDSYVKIGNTWLISSETWNFSRYVTSFLGGPLNSLGC
jgi:hypothetical protein